AATFGGVAPRSAFQMNSRTRFVTNPVRAPRPMVMAFQPYFLVNGTLATYPEDPLPTLAPHIVGRDAGIAQYAGTVGHFGTYGLGHYDLSALPSRHGWAGCVPGVWVWRAA